MNLKLDENGNVVVINGQSVYIHDDGKEITSNRRPVKLAFLLK